MQTRNRNKVYPLAMIAVMAAVMAVVSPFTLPIGPVPITLANLVVYLSVYILGWKKSCIATLVYILLGAVGMPVFSGFAGGLGKLVGPTGGYIIGYLPQAMITGLFIAKFPRNRWMQLLGMVVAGIALYAFGTAWFCFLTGKGLVAALGLCVIPFLPGDFAKAVIAMVVGPMIRDRLDKAGLAPVD